MRSALKPCVSGMRQDTLWILLAPAKAVLEDFERHGHVEAVRRRGLPVDLLLMEAGYQEVIDRSIDQHVHTQLVQPAWNAGYRAVWLCGISLGGFIALHFAARHPGAVTGLHLIAPYPGTGDVLDEIQAAGGALAWSEAWCGLGNDERCWWKWLATQSRDPAGAVPVHLSISSEDRFSEGQDLLAGLLPEGRVMRCQGSHDWATWTILWNQWLDAVTVTPTRTGRPG